MSRFTLCLCASLNGLLSIALVLPAFADAPTPFVTVTSSDSRDLHTSLDGLVNDPVFRHAGIGVMVQSLDTGHVLYEHDADRALMPASNNKILTASAALLQLGTDYTFTTTLYRTGTVGADGTLSGDLFLRGMGDPSFASADLLAMAKTLQAQGIKRVNGRFVADASRFTDGPLGSGWSWDDEPYSYAPQISALTCDENVLLVSAAPSGTPGNPAQVTLGSDDDRKAGLGTTGYIRVRNTAMTVLPPKLPAAEPPTVSFERPRGQNLFAVSGAIALGAKPAIEVLTLEDPDVYTLTRLTELLPLAGVAVPEAYGWQIGRGQVPPNAVMVAQKRSQPLSVLIKDFLKPSDNLYGELLLRTLGAEKKGMGTAFAGASVVRELLKTAGADTGGWNMADGSGLSREDTVTPRQLMGVLAYMDSKVPSAVRTAFYDGLPVGGVDGTLRNRFKGTAAQGNVHAKTGSLSRVSSLSGYVTTKAGERLVFSILMNNYDGSAAVARATQDQIVLALLDVPKP